MIYKFSELFKWTSGKPIVPSCGEIPIYGSNGIIGYTDSARFENKVILGRVGAYCGSVTYCKGLFNATDNTLVTTCDESKIVNQYAYYLLKSFNLNAFAGGAAQPLITQSILKRLRCDIPSIDIQQRIASILLAYDKLIENNNKRIRILEKMAENLYKEWFVRFRFPGHENVPMENGLPKGWESGILGSIVEFQNGFAFKSESFCEIGQYSIVTIKNVQTIGFDGYNTDKIKEIPKGMPEYCKLNSGDVLLSLTGNVGRVCRVQGYDYLLNQRVARLQSRTPYYIYYLFRSEYIFRSLNTISYGTAQLNLSPIKATKVKVVIPNNALIYLFEQEVEVMTRMTDYLYNQNSNLARQRDLLLPRLMSGKLSINVD